MAAKKGVDVMSVLAGATSAKKSKSKVIQYPNKVKNVTELVELNRDKDEIEAKIKMLQTDIRALVEGFYREQMALNYDSSMKVPGIGEEAVTISWQNRYTKVGPEMVDTMKEIVGDANFEALFKNKITITVQENATDEMLQDLITRVGADEFAKFFSVKREIVATEKFHRERAAMLDEAKLKGIEQIVRQTVSFRVGEGHKD